MLDLDADVSDDVFRPENIAKVFVYISVVR